MGSSANPFHTITQHKKRNFPKRGSEFRMQNKKKNTIFRKPFSRKYLYKQENQEVVREIEKEWDKSQTLPQLNAAHNARTLRKPERRERESELANELLFSVK